MPINFSMTINYCTQLPQNWQSVLIMHTSRSSGIQHVHFVP